MQMIWSIQAGTSSGVPDDILGAYEVHLLPKAPIWFQEKVWCQVNRVIGARQG